MKLRFNIENKKAMVKLIVIIYQLASLSQAFNHSIWREVVYISHLNNLSNLFQNMLSGLADDATKMGMLG
jgi:hypothetical protein